MSEISELHTIRDFIRWAVSQFNREKLYYGHGTDNAWDDAFALVLGTLHLSHDINPAMLDARLTPDEREVLLENIKTRAKKRVPVPYITNEAWFSGLPFYVNTHVLIPRSPMAELIQNQFQPWLSEQPTDILDLCTGSGCIAIACAKMFPEAEVDASDISADAMKVCHENIQRHDMQEQVHAIQSDLWEHIPHKQYDLIVSNPPYVDQEDMLSLPAEYKHEPTLALAAGIDGLDIVTKILEKAANYLKPNGILIVEVGNSEYALAEKFPEIPFTWLEFEHGGGGVFVLTREQLK